MDVFVNDVYLDEAVKQLEPAKWTSERYKTNIEKKKPTSLAETAFINRLCIK